MSIRLPDPFVYPGLVPGFLSAPLVDNEPILQDTLPNGTVLEVESSTQYWSIAITYPELYEQEFRIINSAILQAKAGDGRIDVALPQFLTYRVQGDMSTTTIAAGQTGSSLVIGNWTATGLPFVGDLFKLTNGRKVYKITSVEVDTVNKTLTLGVYPKLMAQTTGVEKPEFNNILFSMKLVNRASSTETLNVDGLYEDVVIALREAL